MNQENIRVRFAPSPTGGLHLGGVRTALFNYLFARHNGGKFILRIEDTDRSRYVEGAEQYIFDCLKWCGIEPDESALHGGGYGPYRQSDRKEIYLKYALELIDKGYAYYAFDTPEELAAMRERFTTKENPSPKYDQRLREQMRNSLTLSAQETQGLIAENTPYVIRLKVPENEVLHFTDIIRGDIEHNTSTVDDKVLLKNDGMPTYHLAAVVDDYLMKISHVFRGEEWLPSLPFHVLLWKYLGWKKNMPQWVHLPLILKPSGKGKLSKRDGEQAGFPVFAMDWKDPRTGEITNGFKERGFLPEAFINMLAMLGWSAGTEQEIFSLDELVSAFSLEKVHKGGARFDFEKAKWYNQQHLLKTSDRTLAQLAKPWFEKDGIYSGEEDLTKGIGMIKERCHLLPDLVTQSAFLFKHPGEIDLDAIKKKWDNQVYRFFEEWLGQLDAVNESDPASWEHSVHGLMAAKGLKGGAVMLPLRVMLVGGKFGPGVFDIAAFIGKEAVTYRVQKALAALK
ncbi:MAG TPA: glutamate--tRNA ligase [Edaphocola sp.]|nr:glutamate--tRNA ligase [Edaphocola sp.]